MSETGILTSSSMQVRWDVATQITWPTSADVVISTPTALADYLFSVAAAAAEGEYGAVYAFRYSVPAAGAAVDFLINFTNDIHSGEPVLQAVVSSSAGAIAGYIVGTATMTLSPQLSATLAASASYMSHKLVDAAFNGKIDELFQSVSGGVIEPIPQSPSYYYSAMQNTTSCSGSAFDSAVSSFGSASRQTSPSPIILDLDGDGTETTALNVGATYFDLNVDGLAEATAGASPDDGLPVRDLNNDGIINDGTELFGDHTTIPEGTAPNGFYALSTMDSNNDGKVDAGDAAFSTLRVRPILSTRC